jgi:TatA/E family protein of Tat protein translocase
MPDIGIPELLIILVIVLILFGPGRLVGVGSALGQTLRESSIAAWRASCLKPARLRGGQKQTVAE